MSGVLAVLTGADVVADGLKPIPHIPAAMSPPDIRLPNIDGSPHKVVQPAVLAVDAARFVGEAVAFVIAETLAIAKDAAEAVPVEYAELPPLGRCGRGCSGGRSGGHRARFRPGRAYRAPRDRHPARHRRADGAARRARPFRCRVGPLHLVCRRRRHRAAQERGRDHPGHRPREGEGRRQGSRRQFRHPQLLLSRVRPGVLGLAQGRPAGEMDLRAAARRFSATMPAATSGRIGAGARRRRQLPGPARHQHQQSRRLHRLLRAADQGHPAHDQPLPHARAWRGRAAS